MINVVHVFMNIDWAIMNKTRVSHKLCSEMILKCLMGCEYARRNFWVHSHVISNIWMHSHNMFVKNQSSQKIYFTAFVPQQLCMRAIFYRYYLTQSKINSTRIMIKVSYHTSVTTN